MPHSRANALGVSYPQQIFVCSEGYFEAFLRRNDLVLKAVSGKATKVEMSLDAVLATLREQIPDYDRVPLKNLLNFDESSFYYCNVGMRSIGIRGVCLHGASAHDKLRMTIGATVRADGVRFPMIVLGHYNHPMTIKANMYISNYGLQHFRDINVFRDYNSKAWMRRGVFKKYLQMIDQHQSTLPNSFLIVGNCSAHILEADDYPELWNIKLVFYQRM